MNNKILAETASLIAHFEGFSPTVYKCAAGFETIGYGHLIMKGEDFPDKLHKDEALQLLQTDIKQRANIEKVVNKNLSLTDCQWVALTSLAFNIGIIAFSGSTLLKKLNVNNYEGVIEHFNQWRMAASKKLPGLQKRRVAESMIFLEKTLLPTDDLPSDQLKLYKIPTFDQNWKDITVPLRMDAINVAKKTISQINAI